MGTGRCARTLHRAGWAPFLGCAHWGHVDNALHGTCRQPHGGRRWGAACRSRLPRRALLLLLLLGRLVAAALLPLVRLELLLEMVEVEVLLLLAV